jgi:hypothetical protein
MRKEFENQRRGNNAEGKIEAMFFMLFIRLERYENNTETTVFPKIISKIIW